MTALASSVQPKLRVSAPADALEAQADQVAAAVMRGGAPGRSAAAAITPQPAGSVQRMCTQCAEHDDEDARETVTVARAARGNAPGRPVGGGTSADIAALAASPGAPLSGGMRRFFEPRFGQYLHDVRLHDGPVAARAADELNARAFTVGRNIVFGRGELAPDTREGKSLIAHELTHVLQQRAGQAPPGLVSREAKPDEPQSDANVSGVEIYLGSNTIIFRTAAGSYRYRLHQEGLEPGDFNATVSVNRKKNEAQFTLEGMSGEFKFSWELEPGKPDPVDFFKKQRQVSFHIEAGGAPAPAPAQPAPTETGADAVALTPEEAVRRCEAGDLPGIMTFPFRGTRFGAAPIFARRDGDDIVVSQPVYVRADQDFQRQTRTLPPDTFTASGVRLKRNQLVRVHVYEPHWYQLNITGSASGDRESELCATGEQMLEIAAASNRATAINIGLTVIDAATLFIPVGRIAGAVARPLAGGARTLTAAAMLGTAEAAPVLGGAASRAVTTVVEEQATVQVGKQILTATVAARAIEAAPEQIVSGGVQAAGRAAGATAPRLAPSVLGGAAASGGAALATDVAAGALNRAPASAGTLAAPASRAGELFYGPRAAPQQAQLEALLKEAFAKLGGKNAPTIVAREVGPNTAGYFKAWIGAFGEISVSAEEQTGAQIANTVYHEAAHARIRELFPFMAEGATKYPALRTAFRHVDEIAAYAFGGYGRILHAHGIVDRLTGALEVLISPWSAYSSANTFTEAIPGIVRDLALLTLYLRLLFSTLAPPNQNPRGTSTPPPTAPAGR